MPRDWSNNVIGRTKKESPVLVLFLFEKKKTRSAVVESASASPVLARATIAVTTFRLKRFLDDEAP